VPCLIGSTVFSEVETARGAAARLTGFFFIERCGSYTSKVGATTTILLSFKRRKNPEQHDAVRGAKTNSRTVPPELFTLIKIFK